MENLRFKLVLEENYLPKMEVSKSGKSYFKARLDKVTYIIYVAKFKRKEFEYSFQAAAAGREYEVDLVVEFQKIVNISDTLRIIPYFSRVEVEESIWNEEDLEILKEAAAITSEGRNQNKKNCSVKPQKKWFNVILDLLLGEVV